MSFTGDESCPIDANIKANPLAQTFGLGISVCSRALAFIVLAIYLPALVGAGLLLLLTSQGPAFVKRAYRRGNGAGEVVYLYEFRTECWRTWQETPVGTFLRHADLHRMPRLMNVLLGEIGAGERVQRVGE